MRPAVQLIACLILLAGCARLEVSTQDVYPFRAEFSVQGSIQGKSLDSDGAIYLTSGETGTVQTYLAGGMPSSTIDMVSDRLILKDMWGKELDTIKLPVSGMAGLIAGDMPSQAYLYKQTFPAGTKVVYSWGVLIVDNAMLPREVHVSGTVPLDLFFKPSGKNVTMNVNYGADSIRILFLIKQGGRWTSS